MRAVHELLDRGTPDVLPTDDLPAVAAAEVDYLAGRVQRWTLERHDVHWGVRARALALSGKDAAARTLLDDQLDSTTTDLGRPCDDSSSIWTPQGLTAAVWAVSRVGSVRHATVLRSLVDGLTPGFLVDDGVPLAPTEQLGGLLSVAVGELGSARVQLELAIERADARAPLWGAVARLELARVKRCAALLAGEPHDPTSGRADATLSSASTFFVAAGCVELERRAALVESGSADSGSAGPGVCHLVEGDRWAAGAGVQPSVEVAPSKGLLALRHLIEHRDRVVPAVEIVALLDGGPSAVMPGLEMSAVQRLLADGQALDPVEVRSALFDDRARSRVSKLLRRTVARLGEQHALLGAHLATTVRTGYGCRYEAPTGVTWRFVDPERVNSAP